MTSGQARPPASASRSTSTSGAATQPGGYVELSLADLRAVARFAAEAAQVVLPLFERHRPQDRRPRAAVEAAWTFADGGRRTNLQRTAAADAHRAAKDATDGAARSAALAAGDAAAAAYLHPIPRADQVGHLLRAAAHAAHAAELAAGGDPAVGDASLEQARRRATPVVVDVLGRYPEALGGRSRVAHLMTALDRSLRDSGVQAPPAR